MKEIEILRKEHDAVLAMAHRLLELVDRYRPEQSSVPILMQVNRLFGHLRVHLVHEDVAVYPALAASKNKRTSQIARSLASEAGNLATELEDFTRHWCCSAAITAGFEEFRHSANALVLAIATRIDREERFLLPLADAEGVEEVQRNAA